MAAPRDPSATASPTGRGCKSRSNREQGEGSETAQLTDSPWFWVALFGVGALAALLASSPKYGLRQGGIETKFQNRQRALQWQGEQIDSTAAVDSTRLPQAPNQRGLLIPLWPVAATLGTVIIFAVAKLWLRELPQPTGDASNSQKP